MNKFIGLTLCAAVMFGCSDTDVAAQPETDNSVVSDSKTQVKTADSEPSEQMNSLQAVDAFKSSGLPIGEVLSFDEATDPNKLLGRPNQYTQKVSFEDTTIEQPNPEFLTEGDQTFNGGTIEVFSTEEEALGRKAYVESMTSGMPMIQQYIYVNHTAVLRLEKDILPSVAKKYEAVFMGI